MSTSKDIQDALDNLDSLKSDLAKIGTGKTAWDRLEASKKLKETWEPPEVPAQM